MIFTTSDCVLDAAAIFSVFFFNDTATTEIYTLSLHDALPIFRGPSAVGARPPAAPGPVRRRLLVARPHRRAHPPRDRKSTRLNSSHANISYAVFCLKKKKKKPNTHTYRHNDCRGNRLSTKLVL